MKKLAGLIPIHSFELLDDEECPILVPRVCIGWDELSCIGDGYDEDGDETAMVWEIGRN